MSARGDDSATSSRSPRLSMYVGMCAAASELTSRSVDGAAPNVAASTSTTLVCTPRPPSAWQKRAQASLVDDVTITNVELRAKRLVSADSIADNVSGLLAPTS